MLEDGEAFKARARLRSVYSSEVAQGRPLLPAAVQAERMVRELVDWAAQMPLFATQLTGARHAWFSCCVQCTSEMRPNAQRCRGLAVVCLMMYKRGADSAFCFCCL